MNEYKEIMNSINTEYNNGLLQIEKLFDEQIKKLMEKEKNDEEAKKQYDKTIQSDEQKYKNKLHENN